MSPFYSYYLMSLTLSQTELFERSHSVSYTVEEDGLCYTPLEVMHRKLLEVLLPGRMKSPLLFMCSPVHLHWSGFIILNLYFWL